MFIFHAGDGGAATRWERADGTEAQQEREQEQSAADGWPATPIESSLFGLTSPQN